MIYQHAHKKTKMLSLATFNIALFLQPVLSCLHSQFLCHALKAIIFINISLKLSCFCKKMQNLLCAGGSAPRPPCLRRLRALLPDHQPSAAGNFVLWRLGVCLQAPKTASRANFYLRAWCFCCCYVILCKLILRLASVCGFPQTALSLNKFAHLWASAPSLRLVWRRHRRQTYCTSVVTNLFH